VAGPLFLELGLAIAVGTAATMLAARLSDDAAAAFALANHVAAMLFIVFRIVGAGVGVVVAQNLGAGRREAADRVARATIGAGTWIGGAAALATAAGAQRSAPLLPCCRGPCRSCRAWRCRWCSTPGTPRWAACCARTCVPASR
jgi:Na+-driven multidrug efflux pump